MATYNLVYNASLLVDEGLGYALGFDGLINTTGTQPVLPAAFPGAVRPRARRLEKVSGVFQGCRRLFGNAAPDHRGPGPLIFPALTGGCSRWADADVEPEEGPTPPRRRFAALRQHEPSPWLPQRKWIESSGISMGMARGQPFCLSPAENLSGQSAEAIQIAREYQENIMAVIAAKMGGPLYSLMRRTPR